MVDDLLITPFCNCTRNQKIFSSRKQQQKPDSGDPADYNKSLWRSESKVNYCQVLLNKIPAKVPVPSPSHHLSHHAIESNHHRKQRLSQHHHLNQDSYYAQPNRSRVRLPVGLGFSTKIPAYKPTFPKGRVLLGHARGAPVLKHYPTVLGLRLCLQWMQPSLIFSASLFSLCVQL